VTEEQIAEFTDCGAEAVDEAVARAKAAFEAGVRSEIPGRERAKIMWRIADLIDEHADELAQLDSLNTGMPLMQAQLGLPIAPSSSATTRGGAPRSAATPTT
jgi:acyl-CoA reductase-like NAD-dependent aldehyde dehydrogenase